MAGPQSVTLQRHAIRAGRSDLGAGGGGSGNAGTIGIGTIGHYSDGTTHGHGWGGHTSAVDPTWSDSWHGQYENGWYATQHRYVDPLVVAICPSSYAQPCRVTGDLDPAIVRRYVRRNASQLAYCFEKQRFAAPQLTRGAMVVAFAIGGDGRVTIGSTTSATLPEVVTTCATSAIERIEFPRSAAQVEYVIAFSLK